MSSSDEEDNDELPETYIEEIVTERQFIDSDGNVQTEVTTVEQVKTKKKKKINQKVTWSYFDDYDVNFRYDLWTMRGKINYSKLFILITLFILAEFF